MELNTMNIKNKEFQRRMRTFINELLTRDPMTIKQIAGEIGLARSTFERFLYREDVGVNAKTAYKIVRYLQNNFSDF